MPDTDRLKHPVWFRLEPGGPHRQSGGLGTDGYNYVFFCAQDGHRWPCPTERKRTGRR